MRKYLPAILLILCVSCRPKPQEEAPDVPEPVPPLGFLIDRYETDTLQVRSGETFTGLMGRLGMNAQDA